MEAETPFRALVQYAVGGGWGKEEPDAQTLPVRVIRGTDFANIASGAYDAVPRRFEVRTKAERRFLRPNDIVLEISGGSRTSNQTTGRTLFVTRDILERLGEPTIPASFCRLVRVKDDVVEPRYAFFALQEMYRSGRAGLYEHHSTGISNFQFEFFLDQELVWLPSLQEQRAIAHILGTLDDKIEVNRRMSETLEAMARALFKSWFVDLDPVRAKAEGRDAGLPKPVADLFPVDSELGEIPDEWQVVALPEVIDVNPSRALRKGDVAPYLDMANMPTRGHSPATVIDRAFGSGMRFVNGDTLVARITPCLENGKTAYVDFLLDGQVGWGSTEYIVLRPKASLPTEFAYCLARGTEFRDFAIQSMTGSSGRQRVPTGSLAHFQLVCPPQASAQAFGRLVKPLFARAGTAAKEAHTLAALRDTLMPKLISGELRMEDVDRFLPSGAV